MISYTIKKSRRDFFESFFFESTPICIPKPDTVQAVLLRMLRALNANNGFFPTVLKAIDRADMEAISKRSSVDSEQIHGTTRLVPPRKILGAMTSSLSIKKCE